LPSRPSRAAVASSRTPTITAAPRRHRGPDQQDRGGQQGADAIERHQSRAAEHAGAHAGPLALLLQLDLREAHLLAHQRCRLLGELLDQIADRPVR
jgi:hypothetical protein